ncbi:uncharacterized protein LOC132561663 [Ylistrum balloti]|uniref:uncharacterized protein LOC132561663 n=1 Tax=Ylistrum balloti TaxID=509963 RepID=UPI002905BBF5|nr:uncharacterized protein LOC132561663 [Ylistrum balloti]
MMDRKLERLRADIREENRVLVEQLEGKIFDLEKENEFLRRKVEELEEHTRNSEQSNASLDYKLNDLEQHGRKNSIRIVSVEDKNDRESVEECVEKVVTLVKNSLKVDINENDIDIAHRLGRFNSDRPRTIICKFTHRRKKTQILSKRRNLRGSKIVIFEDLTKRNQDILKQAYRLKSVKHSYSVNGKLFVVLENGKKRRLEYDTELSDSYLADDRNLRSGSDYYQ